MTSAPISGYSTTPGISVNLPGNQGKAPNYSMPGMPMNPYGAPVMPVHPEQFKPDQRLTGSVPTPPSASVPIQLAKDFLAIVKKGNIEEIMNFINQYNLDVARIVDDNFRHTCLFYAALIKDPDVALKLMQTFVNYGVQPTYTDILNQTVLYYVAREGKFNCVDFLVSKGCSVSHRDQYGQTPLYYAAREGHFEIAKKLIQLGADVNNEDANGQTALFYAAREGRKNVCELLIQAGTNVNKQDKKRTTALHWAKKHGKTDIVELLIANGAIPPKEPAPEKTQEKQSKKAGGNKKKEPEKNVAKKYVLTVFKDGIWRPLNQAEIQEFINTNPEVGEYLKNPTKLETMPIPATAQPQNIFYHWDKAASKILNHIWKQHGAWHFQTPVDPVALHIPDYHNIVKRPMDLGTIKKKLSTGAYNNVKEFISDMELVFDNSILYNGETSDFGVLAKGLKEEFRKQCQVHSLDFYMQ